SHRTRLRRRRGRSIAGCFAAALLGANGEGDRSTPSPPPSKAGPWRRPTTTSNIMRAAVFVGTEHPLTIEYAEPQAPDLRDVDVQMGASGVCHSDLSIVHGYVPLPPGVVLGHEGTGRVVEVGSEVTKVKKGDRVVASFVPACGTCWFCLHDQSNHCEQEA